MIGKVSGRIDYKASDHVLIETAGVGYVVYCSERTLAGLPAKGEFAALYTELVVREDLLQLYGFLSLAEKEWHRLLTSVQGVGAKAALAILGTLGPDGVGRALSLGDATAIKAAPGIGPKIAQRVIMELRNKAPSVIAMGGDGAQPAMVSGMPDTPQAMPAAQPQSAEMALSQVSEASATADALSALTNLGYSPGDAAQAVAEAAGEGAQDAAALIRLALKRLAPKG